DSGHRLELSSPKVEHLRRLAESGDEGLPSDNIGAKLHSGYLPEESHPDAGCCRLTDDTWWGDEYYIEVWRPLKVRLIYPNSTT
ncbi:MAG TPA: hypothetical protein VNS88_12220, partial [Nitrospiraceae bacterium]|nr:hypothetical protein [Nitrospiraceae bacterium]